MIGAVSGGVDSTVAAVLMHQAIGDRFHAILVDNGCLRSGEAKEVRGFFLFVFFRNSKANAAGVRSWGKCAATLHVSSPPQPPL